MVDRSRKARAASVRSDTAPIARSACARQRTTEPGRADPIAVMRAKWAYHHQPDRDPVETHFIACFRALSILPVVLP